VVRMRWMFSEFPDGSFGGDCLGLGLCFWFLCFDVLIGIVLFISEALWYWK
jgi:hypothetical protein